MYLNVCFITFMFMNMLICFKVLNFQLRLVITSGIYFAEYTCGLFSCSVANKKKTRSLHCCPREGGQYVYCGIFYSFIFIFMIG